MVTGRPDLVPADNVASGPVQRQLAAYNRHDLTAFLDCYADDVVIRHADGRVLLTGRTEMEARYGALFAAFPEVRAQVPTRIELDGWTVDEEIVEMGERSLHVVVGYQIRDELIRGVVMIRSDQ